MRRVLADLFRQTRWIAGILLTAFTIGGLVLLHRASPEHAGRWLNYASLGADLFGVLIAATTTDTLRMIRWVFTVPVRRRDVGHGLWFVNVIAPVSLTVAAKVMLLGIGTVLSPNIVTLRWVASSSLFDFVFAGSLCWLLLQAAGRTRMPIASRLPARASRLLVVTACVGGALTLGWYMPSALTPWSWPMGVALAGMLALTIAGYRQSERLAIHGGLFELFFTAAQTRDPDARDRAAVRMAFDSRLSGPRRLLWDQFRISAVTQLALMLVVSVLGALPLDRQRGFLEQSLEVWSDPDLRPMMWVMGWILYVSIGNKRWQASRIAVLRGLPISAREINQLLLLRPVVTWLAFWLVTLPFYILARAGDYPWLGFGALVAMMGVTGLAGAALLRWHRHPLSMFTVMGVNYGLLFGHPWQYVHTGFLWTTLGQFALFALGAALLRATYLWHTRLLTRSSALYRGSA
jgi:hypothetical protein